ncbi:hypothetical protein ACFYXQ_42550 [Nocardia jiangxiensis]|uniref:Uncharacterized protein n=1 Tax=Nocardia jiangxiensis TaxID=282685 RepID=A0ABW6SDP8_9NOCA
MSISSASGCDEAGFCPVYRLRRLGEYARGIGVRRQIPHRTVPTRVEDRVVAGRPHGRQIDRIPQFLRGQGPELVPFHGAGGHPESDRIVVLVGCWDAGRSRRKPG